ncbi:MAG: hypothetical protein HYU59_06720 [Magnetospirillum gryphiswaldense]|nr:hypothetical protein [Magnetospirillum gryphiswaldense]
MTSPDGHGHMLISTALAHLLRGEGAAAADLLARLRRHDPAWPGLVEAEAYLSSSLSDVTAIAAIAHLAEVEAIRDFVVRTLIDGVDGDAADWWEAALLWSPDDRMLLSISGRIADGRRLSALRLWRRLAERWPGQAPPALLIALLEADGRFAALDRLARRWFPAGMALQVQGQSALFRGDADQAAACLARVEDGYGDSLSRMIYLLHAYLLLGRTDEARLLAVGMEPLSRVQGLGWRAMIECVDGDRAAALVTASLAVEGAGESDLAVALGFLGLAQTAQGQLAAAADSLDRAAARGNYSPWLLFLSGSQGGAVAAERLMRSRRLHRGAFQHFGRLRTTILGER